MEATAKPNILPVMTDDQLYYSLGVMGSVMSRLVALGMRFNDGYVATPVCGPARVRWKDGFEELYDYENDPELLDGEINTPRERPSRGLAAAA